MHEIATKIPELVMADLLETDLERLELCLNDPVVYANTLTIPSPYTAKDARDYYDHVRSFQQKNQVRKDWTIRYHDQLIGGIGLLYNHGLQSHKSEFGYWLAQEHRGKGLMSLCVLAFSRYILENFPIQRLEAHVFAHNPTSCRVLEKCGFSREGYVRNAFIKDGKPLDAFLYALLKQDA